MSVPMSGVNTKHSPAENWGRVLAGTSLHLLVMSLLVFLGAPISALFLTPFFAVAAFVGVELVNPAIIPAIRERRAARKALRNPKKLAARCLAHGTCAEPADAAWAWVCGEGYECLHVDLGGVDRHVRDSTALELRDAHVVQLSTGTSVSARQYAEAAGLKTRVIRDAADAALARNGLRTTREIRERRGLPSSEGLLLGKRRRLDTDEVLTVLDRIDAARPAPVSDAEQKRRDLYVDLTRGRILRPEYDRRIAALDARPTGIVEVNNFDRKALEADMKRLEQDFERALGQGYKLLDPGTTYRDL